MGKAEAMGVKLARVLVDQWLDPSLSPEERAGLIIHFGCGFGQVIRTVDAALQLEALGMMDQTIEYPMGKLL